MKFTLAILFIIGTTIQIAQSDETQESENTAEKLWNGAKEEAKEEYNEAKAHVENAPEEINNAANKAAELANAAEEKTEEIGKSVGNKVIENIED